CHQAGQGDERSPCNRPPGPGPSPQFGCNLVMAMGGGAFSRAALSNAGVGAFSAAPTPINFWHFRSRLGRPADPEDRNGRTNSDAPTEETPPMTKIALLAACAALVATPVLA